MFPKTAPVSVAFLRAIGLTGATENVDAGTLTFHFHDGDSEVWTRAPDGIDLRALEVCKVCGRFYIAPPRPGEPG